MKKCAIIVWCAVIVLCGRGLGLGNELDWQNIGKEQLDAGAVLVDRKNERIIYFGSKRGVFKTEDAGRNWRNVLSIKGQNEKVNFLAFSYKDNNSLFAATGNGLYYTNNQGDNWKRIFKGRHYLEAECTAIMNIEEYLFLGTKQGLFVSGDFGKKWQKKAGMLSNSRIFSIAADKQNPDFMYVVSDTEVFKSKNAGVSWERIFVVTAGEVAYDNEHNEDKEDSEEPKNPSLRYITVDPNNPAYLYLASSKGVYKSIDKGLTWGLLTDYGLLDREVRFLFISDKGVLYAVTKSGIFGYAHERWQELSLKLDAREINSLDFDKYGNLYAASDNGIFRTRYMESSTAKNNTEAIYSKDEPQISEVQKAAIKYAEVEPEKIMLMRKQAGKKAILPRVSTSINRDTSDLWHWESGSTTKTSDDVLVRGRDTVGWDVTLTWDLGEIIWNPDQTSIDARSRLLVELREDILDTVTKLYFERIRVKNDLENIILLDKNKRFEKELHLQELTASIDALTGGFFSERIKKK